MRRVFRAFAVGVILMGPVGIAAGDEAARNIAAKVCGAFRDAEPRSTCCRELHVPLDQCRFMGNKQRESATPTPPPYPVAYTIVKENIYDKPIKTQINQDIVVSGVPTKTELKAEILRRYRAAMARGGFRNHSPPTNIYIRVYGTDKQARAGQGLWIGMIAKSFGDEGEPPVQIDYDRSAALSQRPEERFGLSEETRNQVFRSITAALHKATRDARSRIPDAQLMKQITVERQLREKYRDEIAARYGLTHDQLIEIIIEGAKKGWITD